MKSRNLLPLGIALLAALGFWGVGVISVDHWHGDSPCPSLGPIPACYLILLGYGLIILSVIPRVRKSLLLFLIGWIPVFALALLGMLGEVTGKLNCPPSEIGIPKCYFSFGLSLLIGIMFWVHHAKAKQKSSL